MTKEEVLNSRKKSVYIVQKDDNNIGTPTPLGTICVNKEEFTNHYKKYNFIDTKSPTSMGQFFVYEKLLDGTYRSNIPHDYELFYPKLGMYINALPCDQTIEVEWIDYRRTWEFNVKYTGEYKDKDGLSRTFQRNMCDNETEIERIPLWGDDLLVYGVWDTMPNWKQLRQAYERTWWFHRTTDELRNIQLDRLLS